MNHETKEDDMADETETLRAELADLRAEVDRLRAWQAGHSCAPAWPFPQLPIQQPPCTCGSTAGCLAHPRPNPPGVWCQTATPPSWLNICGANALSVPTLNIDTTCGQPPTVITKMPTQGCADQGQASVYYRWPSR